MNVGEKSAVEAMLGLSRPSTYPNQFLCQAQPLTATPSALVLPSVAPQHLGSPSANTIIQGSTPDITCGSSVSPSLSPVQHKPLPHIPQHSDAARPKAMRLSQLLTDDSQPDVPLRTAKDLVQQQAYQQVRLPPSYSLQLPLPSSTALTTRMPMTEPVTPPFSPPVLPPLTTVTGITIRHNAINKDQNRAPISSTWLPTPMQVIKTTDNVLTNRENTMPRADSINHVVQSRNMRLTSETVKKIAKRPYKKYYSNPTPSSHCHVCARTSKAVKFAICARIAEGLCRKVTCYKCFAKFGWDWESAVNSKTWICVHCRGACPEGRSQCYIYSRVNSKRESKRGKKAAKAKAKAEQQDVVVEGIMVSQNSNQGGNAVVNTASSQLPSIGEIGGQGVTSFSDASAMQHFIRPV